MNEQHIAENFPKDEELEEIGVSIVRINGVEITPESFHIETSPSAGGSQTLVMFLNDDSYFAAFRVDWGRGIVRQEIDYTSGNVVVRYNGLEYEVGSNFI